MTIEDMLKNFAEHPALQALVERQLDYYLPKWAEEKKKEELLNTVEDEEKQFLMQCILLMNLTGAEIEEARKDAAYQKAEALLADIMEGDSAAQDALCALYDANVARERARREKELDALRYKGLPASKRAQVDALRDKGEETAAARILTQHKGYGQAVKRAEESSALFDMMMELFNVRAFTAALLKANSHLLPELCAAVAAPHFLAPPSRTGGEDALPGEWYLHRTLTVQEYKELLARVQDQETWHTLLYRTVQAIREKAELPLLPIMERKELILNLLENFERKQYSSVMVLVFPLIEGLLWALAQEIGAVETVFIQGDGWQVYDCRKKEPFQTNRIRDIVERTAVSRHLDPGFIEKFCGELYEERNPVLHGRQICNQEICKNLGMCLLQKFFVLEYVMDTLEKVARKRLYDGLDQIYEAKRAAADGDLEKDKGV